MSFQFSTTLRNAIVDAFTLALDGGKIAVYTAARPSPGAAITTQVKLVEYQLAADAAPAAVNGQASLNTPTNLTGLVALATGTAAWARLLTSGGAFVADIDASDLSFSPRAVTLGQAVTWSSLTIIAPGL